METVSRRARLGPVERGQLHCLGGFVVIAVYGRPRTTKDLDAVAVAPAEQLAELVACAGRGAPLHKKHRVFFDYVTVATVPYEYETRITEAFVGRFARLRLFAMDAHDIVLTKLERNGERDRDDAIWLALNVPLDLAVLRQRYEREVRPYLGRPEREDLTLDLWIEQIEEARAANL